jgi:hypothetical protein
MFHNQIISGCVRLRQCTYFGEEVCIIGPNMLYFYTVALVSASQGRWHGQPSYRLLRRVFPESHKD